MAAKKLTIDVSEALHKRISKAAKKEGVPMYKWVQSLLLEKTRKPKKS